MLKKIVGLTALAGLCVWIGASLQGEPQTVVKNQVVTEYVIAPASVRAASTDMAIAAPFGSSSATPTTPAAPIIKTELGYRMLMSKDAKQFVLESLTPENVAKGGAFYANEALRECDGGLSAVASAADEAKMKTVHSTTTITPRQLKGIDALTNKCASLTPEEVAELRTLVAAAQSNDPLFKLATARGRAKDKQAAMDAVYASKNSALITKIMSATGGSWENMLGVCVEGEYCHLDFVMTGFCGNEGQCYDSREEFVLGYVLKNDREKFEHALQVAERTRASISRGERPTYE